MFALSAVALLLLQSPQPCDTRRPLARLDHVVIAVADLDRATEVLAEAGFRFKPGRLHANHLLNRHIKFRRGGSLELMTVKGEPLDRMAREYAALIADGDGGAYAALATECPERVAALAEAAGFPLRRTQSGSWTFLDFVPGSAAAAVFFGAGWNAGPEPDSLLAHRNGAIGLDEAWIEGGRGLLQLLRATGATTCGGVTLPDGRLGECLALAGNRVVVVPPARAHRPFRVVGVVLAVNGDVPQSLIPPSLASGVWIQLRPRP